MSDERCEDTELLVRDCRGIACGHGSREPTPEQVRARHASQSNAAFGFEELSSVPGLEVTSRLFRASYPGECVGCGEHFVEGDQIASERGGGYVCYDCTT